MDDDIAISVKNLTKTYRKLGERKIDIAVYPDTTRPFPRMVMQEGVRL